MSQMYPVMCSRVSCFLVIAEHQLPAPVPECVSGTGAFFRFWIMI